MTNNRKKFVYFFPGMTKIKMSGDKNQETNSSSTEFIERRRSALERYLNRTAAHPMLGVDPDFIDFLKQGKRKDKLKQTFLFLPKKFYF